MAKKPTVATPRRANGEGSIYWYEPRQCWRGSVTVGMDSNGRPKRRTVQGKNPAEVKRKMKPLLNEKDAGTYIDPTKLTVAEWLNQWFDVYSRPNLKPKSELVYKYCIDLAIEKIGRLKMAKVTTLHIQQALNELANEPKKAKSKSGTTRSGATMTHIRRVIRMAFQQAVEDEIIAKNPVEKTKQYKPSAEKITPVPEEDLAKIADQYLNYRYGILIPLLLESGLRIGELLALDDSDLDSANKTISVSKTQYEIRKVGDAQSKIHVGSPKSTAGIRVIPITDAAESIIRYLRRRRATEKVAAGLLWQDCSRLITSKIGEPVYHSAVYRDFLLVAKKAGAASFSPHQLRHSYATRLITAGVNPRVVQDLLGHENIDTSMKIYSTVTEQARQEAAEKLTILSKTNRFILPVADALRTVD